MKKEKLNWLERIYLVEVVKGLLLTTKHFFRNIFFHILQKIGLVKEKKAAVTYLYPEERRKFSPRVRTLHRLTKRSDGSPKCVACMMCETICPANCIYIIEEEHPDHTIEKRPREFKIDLGVCVFCGFCVEACPVDAIRMDTGILEISEYTRKDMVYDMKRLLR